MAGRSGMPRAIWTGRNSKGHYRFIAHPDLILSVSPDRRLVAVGSNATGDPKRWGECRVYLLEDGTLQSTFRPPEALVLKAAFTGESDQCLIVSRPYNAEMRAYLTKTKAGEVLQEGESPSQSPELKELVSSPETGEVFAAVSGGIGRFSVGKGGFEYEHFYSTGAFGPSCQIRWLDYHAGTGRLAVGEIVTESRRASATRIVDVKNRKACDAQINIAGPLTFSPDGKAI